MKTSDNVELHFQTTLYNITYDIQPYSNIPNK